LQRRAVAQGLPDPRIKAEQVFLFLEGVWASVRMFGSPDPLSHAETALEKLIS
jgi:hypothetical protein